MVRDLVRAAGQSTDRALHNVGGGQDRPPSNNTSRPVPVPGTNALTPVGNDLYHPCGQWQRLSLKGISSRSDLHWLSIAIHRPPEHYRHFLLRPTFSRTAAAHLEAHNWYCEPGLTVQRPSGGYSQFHRHRLHRQLDIESAPAACALSSSPCSNPIASDNPRPYACVASRSDIRPPQQKQLTPQALAADLAMVNARAAPDTTVWSKPAKLTPIPHFG